MKDTFGRTVDYLRFSLTKRCQLTCPHCAKNEGGCLKESEMKTDTVIRLSRLFGECGFRKIRFTGGEPLLRNDICEIISAVSDMPFYDDIALTTNGQLLALLASDLKQSGLHRVNISLNTLNAQRSKEMFGADLSNTFSGIEAVFRHGLTPLKINTVILKGQNDDEIADFIALAHEYPLTVRFIELMPMGDSKEEGISGAQILRMYPQLLPVENKADGVAMNYRESNAKGTVGFINPISSCFCDSCSRMRLTADGTLRPCLGNNLEIPLVDVMYNNDLIKQRIQDAVRQKPCKNSFSEAFITNRTMNNLGG